MNLNLIMNWIMRVYELRDAIARGQVAGSMLIPNFLSSLQVQKQEDDQDLNDTSRAEYALLVVILAVIVIAGYRALGGSNLGLPM